MHFSRILFINQHYLPDFAATAQICGDLAETLARRGHHVEILTSDSIYDGRVIPLPSRQVIKGVHVRRVKQCVVQRERLRLRAIGYLAFHVQAHLCALRGTPPDVVVSLTTPPLIDLIGAWSKTLRASRHIPWVMDIYPNIAVETGVLSGGVLARIWGLLSALSLRQADRVITLSPGMKHSITLKGVPPERISVVPPWADAIHASSPSTLEDALEGELITPEIGKTFPDDENPFRRQHVPSGRICVMYSGNMGTCHLWKEIAEAVESLVSDERIFFLFIGGGKGMPLLRESIGHCVNVKFLPYQERQALPFSLAAGDIHLTSLDPRVDGLLLPSKLFGIMAAGRPVVHIGSPNSDVADLLRENGCGIVSSPGSAAPLVAIIQSLVGDVDQRTRLGEAGRKAMLEKYERRILVGQMVDILEAEAEAGAAAREKVSAMRHLALPIRMATAAALIVWAFLGFQKHLDAEAWSRRIEASPLETALLDDVRQVPKSETLLRNLAEASTDRVFPRRWDAAAEIADHGMAARPFSSSLWTLLGRAKFMNGRQEQAFAALNYAAELSPGFPGSRLQALPIYVLAGEGAKAEALAREISSLDMAAPFEVVPELEASGYSSPEVWNLSSGANLPPKVAARLLRAMNRPTTLAQEQLYDLIPHSLREDASFRADAVQIFRAPLAPRALEELWRLHHGEDVVEMKLDGNARLMLQSPTSPFQPREPFHFGWQRPPDSLARSAATRGPNGEARWQLSFRGESSIPQWVIHRGLLLGEAQDLQVELRLNCIHSSDDRFRLIVSSSGGERRGEWISAAAAGPLLLTAAVADASATSLLDISLEMHGERGVRSSAEVEVESLDIVQAVGERASLASD